MALDIDDILVNTISGNTMSASTIFSGGSDLSFIFATQTDSTSLQNQLNTKVNKSGDTMTGQLTTTALSATTISGATLFSGSTNLYSIFSQTDTNDVTRVQPGSNINTGGTANAPTISLVSSPSINSVILSGVSSLGTFSASTISGTTFVSGSTDLYNIFSKIGQVVTNVNAGSNITTGGTATSPTINLVASPSLNAVTLSGTSSLGVFSATTISGTTFISGSTNLYSIFQRPELTVNNINAGSNITTGGTAISPTINLTTSPSVNGIISSGTSQLSVVTAMSITGGTVSGGTLFSGSTDLNSYFNQDRAQINTKVNKSGDTMTGQLTTTALSATTISGGTLFSGSTNLYSIFAAQGGSGEANTASNLGAMGFFAQKSGVDLQFKGFSAGTNMLVTSSSTENAVAVSPTPIFTSVSSTTITASTIYINNYSTTNSQITNSSSTGTGLMFDSANVLSLHTNGPQRLLIDSSGRISNGAQSVQSTYNTYLSGNTALDNLSGGTISGGTIYSGSTNLNSLFSVSLMAADTIRGNNTLSPANGIDLTVNQTMVLLDYYGKTLSINKGNFTF